MRDNRCKTGRQGGVGGSGEMLTWWYNVAGKIIALSLLLFRFSKMQLDSSGSTETSVHKFLRQVSDKKVFNIQSH